MTLNNPVLHRELREALLSRRLMLTQWLFVAAVAAMTWLAWPREPKLMVHQMEVAQRMFSLFWGGLYFIVALLAAALSSVAITREKETGCFESLCVTGQSTSSLLIGKLLAVGAFLMLLIVSLAPVTATCYLIGGISWQQIGLQYVDLMAGIVVYGGLGLACSCLFERNHQALPVAFALALPLAAWSTVSPPARHWIEIAGLLTLAVSAERMIDRVRRPHEDPLLSPGHGPTLEITVNTDSAMDRLLIPTRAHKPFSDARNPVFEREWSEHSDAESRTWWHFLLRFNLGMAVLMVMFLFFARYWLQDQAQYSPAQYEARLGRYADVAQLLFFSYLVLVAVLIGPAQSAVSISKERERRTFDLLVTTMLRPREIILGKWRLGLQSGFHLLVLLVLPLLPALALIVFGKTSHPGAVAMIATAVEGLAVVAATLVTLNTVGMFCSLACRTSAQALSVSYSIAVGWFVGPAVAYYFLTHFSELTPSLYGWTTFLTPFLSLFSLSGSHFFQVGIAPAQPIVIVLGYIGLTAAVNIVLIGWMVLWFDRFWKKG